MGSWNINSLLKVKYLILTLMCFPLAGCTHVRYVAHLVRGQMAIYNRERPINDVLEDPSVSSKIKEKLKLLGEMKIYVEKTLGFKATSNYTTYVQLDRPVANWVLVAAPQDSLDPKQWCFPVVGCFPYMGFFDRGLAQEWEASLKTQGFDTYIRGAAAYSTLGYLRDPFLSSMISDEDSEMANLIFHETTHSHIFISNEGDFNEQVASFVGEFGERLYLVEKFGVHSKEVQKWNKNQKQRKEFALRVRSFAQDLRNLYASSQWSVDEKKIKKEKMFQEFLESIPKKSWKPHFLNNAAIAAHLTYEDDQEYFEKIFENCGHDLRKSFVDLKHFANSLSSSNHKDAVREAFRTHALQKSCTN